MCNYKVLVAAIIPIVAMINLSFISDVRALENQTTGTGINTEIKPFLTIPYSLSNLKKKNIQYSITEGWIYSVFEQNMHGKSLHNGIDFAAPYGTPVYAPFDGYAHTSYYNTTLGKKGDRRFYSGSILNYGLGYFIQMIYQDPNNLKDPSKALFVQFAHLKGFGPNMPQLGLKDFQYDPNEDAVKVNNYQIGYKEIEKIFSQTGYKSKKWIFVKKGTLIGFVGTSGIEKSIEIGSGFVPDQKRHDSWDEGHIHFSIYRRDSKGYKIGGSGIDPYNLYSGYQSYPDQNNDISLQSGTLFLRDNNGKPIFAKK